MSARHEVRRRRSRGVGGVVVRRRREERVRVADVLPEPHADDLAAAGEFELEEDAHRHAERFDGRDRARGPRAGPRGFHVVETAF